MALIRGRIRIDHRRRDKEEERKELVQQMSPIKHNLRLQQV